MQQPIDHKTLPGMIVFFAITLALAPAPLPAPEPAFRIESEDPFTLLGVTRGSANADAAMSAYRQANQWVRENFSDADERLRALERVAAAFDEVSSVIAREEIFAARRRETERERVRALREQFDRNFRTGELRDDIYFGLKTKIDSLAARSGNRPEAFAQVMEEMAPSLQQTFLKAQADPEIVNNALALALRDTLRDNGAELSSPLKPGQIARVLSALQTVELAFPKLYKSEAGERLLGYHDLLVDEGLDRAMTSADRAKIAYHRISRGNLSDATKYHIVNSQWLDFARRHGLDGTDTFVRELVNAAMESIGDGDPASRRDRALRAARVLRVLEQWGLHNVTLGQGRHLPVLEALHRAVNSVPTGGDEYARATELMDRIMDHVRPNPSGLANRCFVGMSRVVGRLPRRIPQPN